ncbi:hypothetical protein [Peijinzhouia sedimentorum]
MRYLEFSIILLAFAIFTISCGEKEKSKIVEETSMESEVPEQIIIELDEFSKAKNSITGFSYIDNYYYFYNDFNQSLYFYSLDKDINTPEKIVKVPLDESINFRSVSEVYIHSMDSIFIFSNYGYEGSISDVFIINDKSEVLGTFDLLNGHNKDPNKFSKTHAVNGSTMFYHEGKVILPVAINAHTDVSKYKPLFIYDLAERKGDYYGEYPASFELKKYSNETYKLYTSLIPELGKVYFSFPYESNLYSFDLSDYTWDEIHFESDLVAQPTAFEGGEGIDHTYYYLTNSWYNGLYFDKASNSLLRLAQIGQRYGRNDPPPVWPNETNYNSLNGDKIYYQAFEIDLERGDYSVISDMNLYFAKFFHPKYGPYRISEINEELGLDPEDYVVFTPMMEN